MAQGLATRHTGGDGPRPWLGIAVFAVAALYLFPFWQRVGLDSDESKIILGALRILQGERLYVDFFAFVPPGLYALVVGVLRTTGGAAADIFWLRLVVVLLGAGGVAGTWAVAARTTRRPLLALLPAAGTLAFGLSLWCIASVHWITTTLALFATWALVEVGAIRAPWRPWFMTGLGTGAVLLVAQHKGIVLGIVASAFVVLYIVHAIRHLERPVTRMVGPEDAFGFGVVLVLGPPLLGLFTHEQLLPMLEAAFGWTREGYGVANRVAYGYLANVLFQPARWLFPAPAVGRVLGPLMRITILYALPASLLGLFGRGAVRWWRKPTPAGWADLTVGLVGLAMWSTALTRPDVLHLLTVAPWGFIAATMLLAPAPHAPKGTWTHLPRRAIAGLALLVLVCWGVGDHVELRRWRSLRLGSLGFERYPPTLAPTYSAAESDLAQTVQFLQVTTAPDEPIFVYPYAPYIYYLADRPNPTRYNICFPGYQGAAAITEIVDTLEQRAVPFVVLDPMAEAANRARAFPGYDPAIFDESPLTQYIRTRYTPLRRFGDLQILQRRAVGE